MNRPTLQRTSAEIADGSDALHGAHVAATLFHDGQFSALYALASTGSLELYPGEGLSRIRREVAEAIDTAENLAAEYAAEFAAALDEGDDERANAAAFDEAEAESDADAMRAFAEWLAEADAVGVNA